MWDVESPTSVEATVLKHMSQPLPLHRTEWDLGYVEWSDTWLESETHQHHHITDMVLVFV